MCSLNDILHAIDTIFSYVEGRGMDLVPYIHSKEIIIVEKGYRVDWVFV